MSDILLKTQLLQVYAEQVANTYSQLCMYNIVCKKFFGMLVSLNLCAFCESHIARCL